MATREQFGRFLYYVPGAADVTARGPGPQDGDPNPARPDLAELGLWEVLGEAPLDQRGVTAHGPDGGQGRLVALSAPRGSRPLPIAVGSLPERPQTWRDCGRYWLGQDHDAPPTPETLARPTQLDGHWVAMGDGNDWLVPRARVAEFGTSALPQRCLYDGAWRTEPHERYAEFGRKCLKLWEECYAYWLGGDDAPDPDFAEWPDLATAALAWNYRVGPWEVGALGLLTTGAEGNLHDVVGAILDVPTLLAMVDAAGGDGTEKKTADASSLSSTADGATASSPASGPPSVGSSSPDRNS